MKKDCKSCEERLKSPGKKVICKGCLTESEKKEWLKFTERKNKKTISDKNQDLIIKLLKKVIGINVNKTNAPAEAWLFWEEKIKKELTIKN